MGVRKQNLDSNVHQQAQAWALLKTHVAQFCGALDLEER